MVSGCCNLIYAVLLTGSLCIATSANHPCLILQRACVDVNTPTKIILPKAISNVMEVRFTHQDGSMACSCPSSASNWGCDIGKCDGKEARDMLGIFMTEHCTNIDIAPATAGTLFSDLATEDNGLQCSWYTGSGVSVNSPSLTIPVINAPRTLSDAFDLWYGEDLCDTAEHDNTGRTCFTLHFMTQSASDCSEEGSSSINSSGACDGDVAGGNSMGEKEGQRWGRGRNGKGGRGQRLVRKGDKGENGISMVAVGIAAIGAVLGLGGIAVAYVFWKRSKYPGRSVGVGAVAQRSGNTVVVGIPVQTPSGEVNDVKGV